MNLGEIAKLIEPIINVIISLIRKHKALYTRLRRRQCPILKTTNVSCQFTHSPLPHIHTHTHTHKPDVLDPLHKYVYVT